MIKRLDSETASRIRGGTVIESPESAVQALVQNSMDAGAKHIAVKLHLGTLSLCVQDDGHGMTSEELDVVGSSYFSSKGESGHGESLSALVSSCSNVVISTRRKQDNGWNKKSFRSQNKLEVSTLERFFEPDYSINGTVVMATRLFGSTPVRWEIAMQNHKNMMESIRIKVFELLAHRIDVRVRLFVNDGSEGFKKIMDTGECGDLTDAYAAVFGKREFQTIEGIESGLDVTMFISSEPIQNSRHQFVFLNKRPVYLRGSERRGISNYISKFKYPSVKGYFGKSVKGYPSFIVFLRSKDQDDSLDCHATKAIQDIQDPFIDMRVKCDNPLFLDISPKDLKVFTKHRQYLSEYGIGFTIGGDCVHVTHLPAILMSKAKDTSSLKSFMIGWVSDLEQRNTDISPSQDWFMAIQQIPAPIRDSLITKSCKDAIKFGEQLTLEEMHHLMSELSNLQPKAKYSFHMFGSPESERFYSGTGSIIDGINNESFSTPLKRLPNANVNSVLHEINEDQQSHKQSEPQAQQNAPLSRSSQFAQLNDMSNLLPLSEASLQASRARIPFSSKQKDNNLFNSEVDHKPKGQVFYKPLYHNRNILPQEFLPPKSAQSGKNKIIRQQEPAYNRDDDELSDDEDAPTQAPSGEWMSPVMKVALSRQVNKERIFKTMCTSIFRLVGFHLVLLFVEYFYKLYQLNHSYSQVLRKHAAWARYVDSEQSWISTAWPHVRHLQWVFIIAIAISIVRLIWPQDQCVDLPLTEKQRQLLGLKSLAAGQIDDDDGDDGFAFKKRHFESKTKKSVLPPRYSIINGLISSVDESLPKPQEVEPEIALSNVIPSRTAALQHSRRLQTDEVSQISKDFHNKFS
ncbi:hypothetical protein CA3LBN_000754 [Candidozyma haemuli]|uniref:DNA mismatch repair protein S5 domain-containing protein n=1 Tax=Candidozyma haemuli TaxID=45357 RepID=A0ABX8I080_9ASCO|nr:hypothetical protein CA3LBN_000754 [[Candida] haemuloni]